MFSSPFVLFYEAAKRAFYMSYFITKRNGPQGQKSPETHSSSFIAF
jgi:hypothetical protein